MRRTTLSRRYLRADGDPTDGKGGSGGGGGGQVDPAKVVPPAKPADPPADPPEGKDDSKTRGAGLSDDTETLKAEILRLRDENQRDRTESKRKAADEATGELIQKLGKALGLVKDDEQIDPQKLVGELSTTKDENTDLKRQVAIFRLAAGAGADAAKLLDSVSFLNSVKEIDASNDKAITDAIKKAVKDNTSFAPRTPGASSVDHVGGSGGTNRKVLPLSQAVAATLQQQIS